MNLPLVIYATGANGQDFYEVTTSINISCNGVYFPLSQSVDQSRELEISVIPPPEVSGMLSFSFKARGRVVRLEAPSVAENSVRLAIQFTEPIHLA